MKPLFIFFAAILMTHAAVAQDKSTAPIPPGKAIDSLVIDINLDGIPDFILKHTQKEGAVLGSEELKFVDDYIILVPYNHNQFTSLPLEYGSAVNEHQKWSSASVCLAWTSHGVTRNNHLKAYNHGDWTKIADEYAGLKLNVNGQSYYGWIKIGVAGDATQIKIYDADFSDRAEQAIFCTNGDSSSNWQFQALKIK